MADKTYKLAIFEQGQGEPVVLLHGQISTHNYMKVVADLVSQTNKTVSLDLLGFGDSPRPKDSDYTVDDHVESIVATLQQNKITQPFILVGHSMGGMIAVRLAFRYPKMVKRLILTGLPILKPRLEYKILAREFPGARALLKGPHVKLLRRLYEQNEARAMKLAVKLSAKRYKDLPEQIRADSVRHSWESYNRSMENVVVGYKPVEDLIKLKIPVTILYGENDGISTALLEHESITQSNAIKLIKVPNSGHNFPLENPEIVAKAILQV